jgi:hypothetical protein
MTDLQHTRRVREIKALSGVVAALSLPIYGSAVFFDHWDARVVSFYVGSVILTIAIGLQIYVRRPQAFGVTEIGDSLRTTYAAPAAAAPQLATAPIVSVAHAFALRSRTRVTRRELIQQIAAATTVVVVWAVGVVAVTWVMAVVPGWGFSVAAAVILAAAFWIGRGFAVGASAPATAPVGTAPASDAAVTPAAPTPHAA